MPTVGFGLTLCERRLLVAVVPLVGIVSMLDCAGVLPLVSLLDWRPLLGWMGAVMAFVVGALVRCCRIRPDVRRPHSSLMGGACLGCVETISCFYRRWLRLSRNVVAGGSNMAELALNQKHTVGQFLEPAVRAPHKYCRTRSAVVAT